MRSLFTHSFITERVKAFLLWYASVVVDFALAQQPNLSARQQKHQVDQPAHSAHYQSTPYISAASPASNTQQYFPQQSYPIYISTINYL